MIRTAALSFALALAAHAPGRPAADAAAPSPSLGAQSRTDALALCTRAAAFLRDDRRMVAEVEPDTMDDWRTHRRLAGCRVTAAGGSARPLAQEAAHFYERVRAAGWVRTPDPLDAPREGSLRFRQGDADCLFNVNGAQLLGTDAEARVNEALRVAPGETSYQVLAVCLPALPAAPPDAPFSADPTGGAVGAVPGARAAQPAAGPSLVILVRHGEKAPVPGDDPPLSAAGQARAAALDSALAHLAPSTIVVSTRRRTVETAAVVQQRTGVTPTVVSLEGGGAGHVQAVARAVRAARGTVLVVGHSNTIPAIVTALGGPRLPDLCDASYATLFLVQPSASADGQAVVVRAQYGAADPPGASACPGMVPR